jgi:hypothetical protein
LDETQVENDERRYVSHADQSRSDFEGFFQINDSRHVVVTEHGGPFFGILRSSDRFGTQTWHKKRAARKRPMLSDTGVAPL